MAWRIADSVIKGEIDNRTRDRVTGKIWLSGVDEPVVLELTGNPYRDLAGQYLRFVNPNPKPLPERYKGFAQEQTGAVGDITAARKVKILDIPDEQFEHYYTNKIPMPYHWGNCLYLEWYSARNGRVVIEATDYELTVEPEATWQMSEEEEAAQQEANGRAIVDFMEHLLERDAAGAPDAAGDFFDHEENEENEQDEDKDYDDDAPQSEAEAVADAEAARMELLNDRVQARLQKEKDFDPEQINRIMREERERLRRERGEPEPPALTPEQEAERIEMMNHAMERMLAEEDDLDAEIHPLVEQCQEFGHHIRDTIDCAELLPEGAQEEHPLNELMHGIWSASAKLAGALNGEVDDWPPEKLFAGDILVRLKKARAYLNDAQAALEAIERDQLLDPEWITALKKELDFIQHETRGYINEARYVLRGDYDLPF